MKLLECQALTKNYKGLSVLKQCQFTIHKGESLGLMGESGAGKSSLAKILVGLEEADAGSFWLNGEPYQPHLANQQIYLVFQDSYQAVNPRLTVQAILEEAASKSIDRADLYHLLGDVGLSPQCLDKTSAELSGGQLQRVCIARALLRQVELIIFDESFSGLDPIIQYQLLTLLHDLQKKRNLTYLFITHDFRLCQMICHRVLVLYQGSIVEEIRKFQFPLTLEHPASLNLIQGGDDSPYSHCRLKKMTMQPRGRGN